MCREKFWYRQEVGNPLKWEKFGRLQLKYLVNEGLKRYHFVLDVGCGPLRAGGHFIRYLNRRHYFGIDNNKRLLEAGRDIEVPTLKLERKEPVLRCVQNFDLSWLNNNYQRSLARYVRHRSAGRLKRLKSKRRYAALVCFLHQLYADTIDFLIEMHDKLMTGVYTRAENNIAKEMNRRRRAINRSLATFHTLGTIVLDDSIDDGQLRRILFQQIDKESLTKQVSEVDK